MFKKTFVAASIFAAFSANAAVSVNIDGTLATPKAFDEYTYSVEGNALENVVKVTTTASTAKLKHTGATDGALVVSFTDANILVGDTITLTLDGANFNTGTAAPSLSIVSGNKLIPAVITPLKAAVTTAGDGAAKAAVVTFLDTTAFTTSNVFAGYDNDARVKAAIAILKTAVAASSVTDTVTQVNDAIEAAVTANVALGKDTNAAALSVVATRPNFLTYKVDSLTPVTGQSFINSAIVIPAEALVLDASTMASEVTLTVSREDKDGVAYAGTSSATLYKPQTQFTGKFKETFNAKIDVNNGRLIFEGNDVDSQTKDTLTFDITNDDTVGTSTSKITNDAKVVVYNYTVNGDFSFLDTDASKADVQYLDHAVTVADAKAGTLKVLADKITWSTTDDGETSLVINVSDKDKKQAADAIAEQVFTASAEVIYDTTTAVNSKTNKTKTLIADESAAGSWTLNGAKASIPTMPYGTAFSQYITVTNTSKVPGAIDVDMYIDGVKSTHTLTQQAEAEKVVNISKELRDLVTSVAGDETVDVAFDLVVNAPDEKVTVQALYYVSSEGDRVAIAVDNK